jgi:hypothetical protein
VGVRLEFGAEIALETRGFVYLGPGVTSLSATEGWQAGGDSLTLDLVDFVPGTPVLVRIGGGEASGTPSGFLAASSVSIVTPQSLSSGAVDVEVIQFLGQANEKRALSPGAWLAEAPRIVGITPASVYQGGGESLTLSLEGLAPNQTTQVELGTQVYTGLNAGTVDLSSFSLVTQLANAGGTVDVRVRQNLGQPTELGALLANGLTIVGPSITALLPTAGPLEGGTNVTVQTSGFQDGVAAQVSLGGFSVPGTVVGSGTSQTVSFQTVLANASGPANLTITQGVFQASLANAFTFDPARVVPYCVSTPSSQGGLPVIGFTGSPSLSVNNFSLTLQNALPNKTAQYIYGQQPTNFPYPTGGTICVGVGVIRGPGTMTSASGTASVPFVIPSALVGQKRYFQYWYRDPAAGGLGFSNALEVEFYP